MDVGLVPDDFPFENDNALTNCPMAMNSPSFKIKNVHMRLCGSQSRAGSHSMTLA